MYVGQKVSVPQFCLAHFSLQYIFISARGARRDAFAFLPKVTDDDVRLPTKLQSADKLQQNSQ
jgi:hypothetical protein